MTEIQFLLDLILETSTMGEMRRKCKDRIGEVEKITSDRFNAQTSNTMNQAQRGGTGGFGTVTEALHYPQGAVMTAQGPQSPSTAQAIARQEAEANINPVAAVLAPRQVITQRIIGGEVQTGNNTKGPRKF